MMIPEPGVQQVLARVPNPSPAPTDDGNGEGFLTTTTNAINGFFDWAGEGFQTVVNVIGVIIALMVLIFLLRYVFRWVHHLFRRILTGEMVYNEIIYEGVVGDGKKSIDLMNNMKNLMFPISSGLGVYFSRPRVSVVIRNSDEDDAAHMYVGISSKHYDESRLRAWASGMDCSIEPIDVEDIGIVASSPAVSVVSRPEASNISNSPVNSTVGNVMSRVQEMMTSGSGGTIMLTFEPMRHGEGKFLINHVTGAAIKAGGGQMALDQGPRNVSIVNSSMPSRGVLAAFSDDGDSSISRSLMDVTTSNIPSLGWSLYTTTPEKRHMRSGWVMIPLTLILVFLSLFNDFYWFITAPVLALNIAAIIGLPWLSSFWISLDAQRGSMAIPPFFYYSLRRIATQLWLRIYKLELDSGQLDRKYIAEPSTAEVIPLYQTSAMQFASMPTTGIGSVNLASSAVPQVPMASGVLNDIDNFVQTDDILYTGMSVKSNDPVYRTVKDINFGIALGGDAGSGKTNALMVDYLGMCRLSRKNSGLAGKMTINPIWFESKSDDLEELVDMVRQYDPRVVKIHDPKGKGRLALEGPRLGDDGVDIPMITENVNLLVDAMEAIWGGGSFGHRSRQIASSALTIAMLLNKEEIEEIFEGRIANPSRPNVIKVMNLIVGGDPSIKISDVITDRAKDYGATLRDPSRKRLKEIVSKMTKEEAKLEIKRRQTLQVAMDSMVNMYAVRDAISPLQNKLPQLIASEGMFDTITPDGELRQEYSVDAFLTYGGPVILDMTPSGSSLTRKMSQMFLMMIHYVIWQRIQKIAGGWAKQGKFINLYADEVTNFTGDKDSDSGEGCKNIIAEVRDQGRSYGVSHNIGFQNFTQMPDRVRAAVLSFQSIIFLQFTNNQDIKVIMDNLGDHTRYSSGNFPMFPQGIGVAKMTLGSTRRTEFTIKTPYAPEWSKALTKAKGRVPDAFEDIRAGEVSHIRREKKKKVKSDKVAIASDDRYNDDYDHNNVTDEFFSSMAGEDNPATGPDDKPLTWG